ncbi:hypothetical protein Chor_010492 [Crotalus horridus]
MSSGGLLLLLGLLSLWAELTPVSGQGRPLGCQLKRRQKKRCNFRGRLSYHYSMQQQNQGFKPQGPSFSHPLQTPEQEAKLNHPRWLLAMCRLSMLGGLLFGEVP